jgi:argonaute-like protein implicated in RNA metabolism and viral defense
LKEYKVAVENLPARLVLHKSSKFSVDEVEGFVTAIEELDIVNYDFVTIQDSQIRIFRDGPYPPYRGSCIELEKGHLLLYTRGSVEYYQTYTGMYIPRPIEIKLFENNESPLTICEEILALTKMNWNNTQFDRKYPVTLDCARKVGEILKYIPENEIPQIRYSFYM